LEELADAGADWLAYEIIDGIRRGRELLEPEDVLQAARGQARHTEEFGRPSAAVPDAAEPILGDDQIVWAAVFVGERLDAILADLEEGFAMLEAVVDSSAAASKKDHANPSRGLIGAPLVIALTGQEDHPIDRGSIAAAKEGFNLLMEALDRWARDAQSIAN